MARHGPQSSVIDPVAWSETVYAEKCANWFYKMQLQSTENWTVLVEFAATASGPVHIAWRNLLALSGHVDPTARHSNELGSDFDSLRAAFAILWNVRLDRRNSASFERLYRIWIWPAAILKTKNQITAPRWFDKGGTSFAASIG